MTPDHLIYEKKQGYIKAQNIKMNDQLNIQFNNGSSSFSRVVKINFEMKNGYIAPLTESGTLIVNGVKASCYASINSHELAHFAMQPLIFWHKITNFLGFTQKKANAKENTKHIYLAFLKYSGIQPFAKLFF